jgi:iron only hydrogenase large subunit-like protein
MSENELILKELKVIKKILLLANSKQVEQEIEKIASTDERKRMWVLMDGKRTVKEIADIIKVTVRAVQLFSSQAREAGLVEYERGKPPIRILDYVPPAWIDLIKLPEEKGEAEEKVGEQKVEQK